MTQKNSWVCIGVAAFVLVACNNNSLSGDGTAKTESRDAKAFEVIALDGAFKLELVTGPDYKLSILADENLLPLITTNVTSGKLVIKETKSMHPKTPIVVTAQAPSVREIDINGAGSVHATGLEVPAFVLDVSGAGDVELSGEVGSADFRLNGAAKVHAVTLVAKQVHVELSGAGLAEVNAVEKLNANVSGVGAVRYRGAPNVEKNISGIGTVSPL